MIREFDIEDLENVMQIWLNSNIRAHDFIDKEYWIGNFDMVKNILPKAKLYVYETHNKIEAFVGIDHGYIAGIFVSEQMQSKGIGKLLLNQCKQLYNDLSLSVYEKNSRAIQFYVREGFTIEKKQMDKDTGEIEYHMVWRKEI